MYKRRVAFLRRKRGRYPREQSKCRFDGDGTQPESTWLRSVVYYARFELLQIETQEGLFVFEGVNKNRYYALLRHKSPGGYFDRHIRNRYKLIARFDKMKLHTFEED